MEKIKIKYLLPASGEKYQHYKGVIYKIIDLATHSETNKILVLGEKKRIPRFKKMKKCN